MALMKSADIKIGTKLEYFVLEDSFGEKFDSKESYGKDGMIIAVMCNHCPYSNAIWERLEKVASFAKKLDINTVAINPNIHPNYPEDSPAHMIDKINEFGLSFPYLVDFDQKVSKSIGAVCTPDIFLFDGEGALYYHGRLDDNWHDPKSVKDEDLREAVISLFGKQEAPTKQFNAQGCSIKWIDTVTG
ncbi:thioredoxin family protein [Sulfurospirillum arcachonense]|uniref:thioredoxin family protein n=1 Tax=Sulfurospirillum arcachonense TaxID=57666 RepID=UPI00046922F8|nr:thioredoxin family protein [Sulfurospirillum arcachonense]